MPKGVIYILTNPSFPDYVKIGYADNLEKRLNDFNQSTAVPFAFRAYATYDVDHRLSDKQLHALIDSLNPDLRSVEEYNGKTRTREFFFMSREDAYAILEAIATISGTKDRLHLVTPTGDEVREEELAEELETRKRQTQFRFSMIGLSEGDQIYLLKDPSITAEVVDDKHIRVNGEITSLSASAQSLLGLDYNISGTAEWAYEGKAVGDIRREMGA